VAALWLTGCEPTPPPSNVLLVMIDSLRADHLSAYGYARATSPHLDRLAAQGVRFEDVVSPTSWTLPATATLMTGLPPEKHGVIHGRMRLEPGARTLAEVFRERGFATAGFAGGPFLRRRHGLAQGFEHYDDSVAALTNPASHRGITSPKLVSLATAWLEDWARATSPRPFFLFLYLWDVHFDYSPPPPYDTLFDPDYAGSVTGRGLIHDDRIHAGMPERDLAHLVALYDGEIRFTDHHLGQLLQTLDALELADDTLVVVTSDHGEEFFEHGKKGHRLALYEESVRVPLILRHPGRLQAGRVVAEPVRLLDLPLTLLSLAGVAPTDDFGFRAAEPAWRTRDLTPLIDGDTADEPPPAFADLEGFLVSIRARGYKLIMHDDRPTEVYALDTDRGERVNLAGQRPEREAALHRELMRWRASLQDEPTFGAALGLSDADESQLRALGYLE
jgi:arylsulfatase A-like enzyme